MKRRSALAFLGSIRSGLHAGARRVHQQRHDATHGGGRGAPLRGLRWTGRVGRHGCGPSGAYSSIPNDSSAPTDSTLPPSNEDAGADASAPDSNVPDTNVPDTFTLPTSTIRFAWFVGGGQRLSDGGLGAPSYDVCIAPHGTGVWQGPLLAAAAFPEGLQSFDVTNYFTVVAGQYDARIVAAGSATCNLPDAGSGAAVRTRVTMQRPAPASTPASRRARTSRPCRHCRRMRRSRWSSWTRSRARTSPTSSRSPTIRPPSRAKRSSASSTSREDAVVQNDAGAELRARPAPTRRRRSTRARRSSARHSASAATRSLPPLVNVTTTGGGIAPTGNGYVDIVPLTGVNASHRPSFEPHHHFLPQRTSARPQSSRTAHRRRGKLAPLAVVNDDTTLSTDSLSLPAGGILTAFYAEETAGWAPRPHLVLRRPAERGHPAPDEVRVG